MHKQLKAFLSAAKLKQEAVRLGQASLMGLMIRPTSGRADAQIQGAYFSGMAYVCKESCVERILRNDSVA